MINFLKEAGNSKRAESESEVAMSKTVMTEAVMTETMVTETTVMEPMMSESSKVLAGCLQVFGLRSQRSSHDHVD